MEHDALKLTTYFGERDRVDGRYLADALLDVYERSGFETSLLLRGAEGFGAKHHLHTQRLLTLSEDLPLVSVGVDRRERVEDAVDEIVSFGNGGLVTLERARLITGPLGEVGPEDLPEATKLTVYCGRRERVDGRPAFVALVDLLHRRGVAGATVVLGVDGTVRGERARARFFARNAEVPLMVISVGSGDRMAEVLPEIGRLLERPLATLERVTVLKRDGRRLADLPQPARDEGGDWPPWQKLTVYAGEQSRADGHPLYLELIRRLRAAGSSGATALRGVWGYHGDHAPHGDRLLSLRRRVPVVTAVVDAPSRMSCWFEIVDDVTSRTGLVTAEVVPALTTSSPLPRLR